LAKKFIAELISRIFLCLQHQYIGARLVGALQGKCNVSGTLPIRQDIAYYFGWREWKRSIVYQDGSQIMK
jgi:hypothetical protein